MRCLILGAYGLLGSSLSEALERSGHEVFRAGRSKSAQVQVDPRDIKALSGVMARLEPEIVINLIAMTSVDMSEQEPAAAFHANVGVVQLICESLDAVHRAHLIHISTDLVYGGPGPHTEDVVAPVNVYAITKFAGELIAERRGASVLRTNFVGRSRAPGRVGFSDWLVESLRARRPITLFDDVRFSPLHIISLCQVIEHVMAQKIPGTYNVGARGGLSKAEFGQRLAQKLGLSTDCITVGSVENAKMAARRPTDMVMNPSLFEFRFDFKMPTIDKEVDRVATDYHISSGETP